MTAERKYCSWWPYSSRPALDTRLCLVNRTFAAVGQPLLCKQVFLDFTGLLAAHSLAAKLRSHEALVCGRQAATLLRSVQIRLEGETQQLFLPELRECTSLHTLSLDVDQLKALRWDQLPDTVTTLELRVAMGGDFVEEGALRAASQLAKLRLSMSFGNAARAVSQIGHRILHLILAISGSTQAGPEWVSFFQRAPSLHRCQISRAGQIPREELLRALPPALRWLELNLSENPYSGPLSTGPLLRLLAQQQWLPSLSSVRLPALNLLATSTIVPPTRADTVAAKKGMVARANGQHRHFEAEAWQSFEDSLKRFISMLRGPDQRYVSLT